MIVLGRRKEVVDDALASAMTRVPKVWAHARAMQMFNRMGALDQESWKLMVQTFGPGWKDFRWVSSIPLSVAAVLNQDEEGRQVFQDTSGRTLFKFLERNPQYKVPKGSQRVQVSVPRTS